ncbi:MAG: Dam family site-specific DNA-(adenine-N6)-methyltransferase [Candidatus Fermentibacter sp.]|nr:Dam family site-specific DNA-(adenine-N6)-methyltransferase [Candidatus Fermentibacter sp.]
MNLDVTHGINGIGGQATMSEQIGVTPPLKWVGGKRWVADRVRALLPPQISGEYYEPFFGGGAIFFSMRPEQLPMFAEPGRQYVRESRARVADLSPGLVEFYEVLRDRVEPLIRDLHDLRDEYRGYYTSEKRERYYTAVRYVFNDNRDRVNRTTHEVVRQAARFLFLNKTGYNGLMRYNRRGELNTPHGAYKNPSIFEPSELRKASVALRGVDVQALDFEECVKGAGPGDAVYLDPPHAPRTEKRSATFTAYTGRAWSEDDDRRVTRVFWDLARRGARVVMSQADTPRARELLREEGGDLWEGVHLESVMRPERVSSKGSGRAAVGEILVAAGPR